VNRECGEEIINLEGTALDNGGRLRFLPLFRRDDFNRGREQGMGAYIHRPVSDPGARRVLAEIIVALPVLRRPDRSGNKTTAAIGADVTQNVVDARGAKGAFIGTDARLKRVGRQGLIAVFTGGSKFKHGESF
jgi:hypothetical protein